ncbi:hypothetical protein IFM89_039675 [Coptis chinensis]|uniref:Uncharacterized protein n=1 Tax=Coptis chinensis TaxID=261450 RepID=A0A835LC54_9MAGN|nr:hypothetical protein IFM89_039675 [Coptis chinensis]
MGSNADEHLILHQLEKEALVKGVPLGQARDIDIPPPRPKRKPNNPYPRKTSTINSNSLSDGAKDGSLIKSASSSHSGKQILDLESDGHHKKPCGIANAKTNEKSGEVSRSGIHTFSQETPCMSLSQASNGRLTSVVLKSQCVFRDFVPSVNGTSNGCATDGSSDLEVTQKLSRTDANNRDMDDSMDCYNNLDVKMMEGEKHKQTGKLRLLPKEEIRSNQNYPRHIPVHVVERSSQSCAQNPSPDMICKAPIIHHVEGTMGDVKIFTNTSASATTENHSNVSLQQLLPNISSPDNLPSNNQDSCNTFVNTTLSNLIVSSLLQNPVAHAAASLAAMFWPFTNVETPADSPLGSIEGVQFKHGSPSPSTSAIAAATVMAASAWWAAHGLLPFYPPPQPGFTCISEQINSSPVRASVVTPDKEKKDHMFKASPWEGQQFEPLRSMALEPKVTDTKLLPVLSSDGNKVGSVMSNNTKEEVPGDKPKPVSVTEFQDSKGKTKEPVDRSSCGSNTPSSSEVEMDMLEKCANGMDKSKEQNINHWTIEPNNHRCRSAGNMNDPWREVSEEGKMAFKALFSREILPQSFSPPNHLGDNGQLKKNDEDGKHVSDEISEDTLDLNIKTRITSLDCGETEKGVIDNTKGLFSLGFLHGKLKTRRTGFKPYKRCSVEAQESCVGNESSQGEKREPKRVRLEGEASM